MRVRQNWKAWSELRMTSKAETRKTAMRLWIAQLTQRLQTPEEERGRVAALLVKEEQEGSTGLHAIGKSSCVQRFCERPEGCSPDSAGPLTFFRPVRLSVGKRTPFTGPNCEKNSATSFSSACSNGKTNGSLHQSTTSVSGGAKETFKVIR